MSSPPDTPETDFSRIAREAAGWFVHREAGFTARQADEFTHWCAADARHRAAFAQVERTHARLLELPQSPAAARLLVELDALTPQRASRPTGVIHRLFPARTPAAVAALAACAALVAASWWWSREPASSRYATTTAMHRAIDLPDGSTLSLSEQSAVRVEFRASERRLQLEHGEARFEVARDARRPFRVLAGSVLVQAVGTAFTVQRSTDTVEVAVSEGTVTVARTRDVNPSRADTATAESFPLSAGERVVLDLQPVARSRDHQPESPAVSIGGAPRWAAPRLVFRDTPLSEVVTRFNRFNRVQLAVTDPQLAGRLVGGSFDADNAEAFVTLLRESGTIAVERVSETRIELRPVP